MEIRGQARSSGIGMPQSMGYNPPPPHNQESPAKLPSASIGSTLPDRSEPGGHGTVISPSQTLDRHNLSHHQHHQLNLHLYRDHDQQQQHHQQQQEQQQQRASDGSPDADLEATTPVTSATVASPSNSKTVPSSQPRTHPTASEPTSNTSVRYRECLKNHAASMGGHVLDGCGEFMPSGEEGTPEALKCAACDCHRNFHRKETQGEQQTGTSYYSTYLPSRTNYASHRSTRHQSHPSTSTIPPQQHKYGHSYTHVFGTSPSAAPMMMAFGGNNGAPAESSSEDLNMFQSDTGQQAVLQSSYSMSKKRFRTKFTQQQKDKMHEFAQKIGWRIQKQDEQEVHQFCEEVGVKRQVFKVWMHNNKQAMKKKEM